MEFIKRDYTRTEQDDWILNIQPKLSNSTGAIEQTLWSDALNKWVVVGWLLKPIFE